MNDSVLDRLRPDQRELLGTPTSGRNGGVAEPMLAVLSDRRAFDDAWLFERKLDGVRALAMREGDRVRLFSRGGTPRGPTYPELVAALEVQTRRDFALDGEVVAIRSGRTDFSLLQQRSGLTDPRAARATGIPVFYYLFDLLRLDGHDLTRLPLRTRKALLRDAFAFHGPQRFTTHRNAWSPELLDGACARGWEGLIAKRADAPYVHRRSTDWLKLKCGAGQEFVIGGFTEPAGSRVGFGALLLGYYESDRLCYAGKVGTGYDTRTLRDLRHRLDVLGNDLSPFHDAIGERAVHWVRPELVAQIGFTEWTRDGRLRHPRFLGLRADKPPADVVRERPKKGP
ncbi:non-homologous end-joining DNA ligase [Streptomyces sp. CA-135486]|uniref:non-homologous end-joining DNA ligase n=1 Tax=Streptomyces sp. CA-135486 TaxID=3240049 RepID=UPI003D8BBDD3